MTRASLCNQLIFVLTGSIFVAACSVTEDIPREGITGLVLENFDKQQEINAQEAAAREAAGENDLLQTGMSLFNNITSAAQNNDSHVADLLPEGVRSFLGVEENSSGQGAGGIEVQSLSGGGSNYQPQTVGGYQVAADPYATGGIQYHNSGASAPSPSPQFNAAPQPQVNVSIGAGQRPASTALTTNTGNNSGDIFGGWIAQMSGGLLGQPTTQTTLPSYEPPQRQYSGQSFDGSARGARALIDRLGASASVAATGRPIAPLAFDALPDDLSGSAPGNKDLFISIMLPISLLVNEQIAAERQAILSTGYQGDIAGAPMIVKQIANRYEVQGSVSTLLTHVDTLPVSLMLAQTIEESGWGTSRFSQEGNALFGQYTWTSSDKGMVPGGRPAGETYRIKAFPTLFDAVKSYALNLNRHQAYASLRASRAAVKRQGRSPSGRDLVQGLAQYSGDPGYYIPAIQAHLDRNVLARYDRASIAPGPMIRVSGGNAPASR